jgi:hypothetical protein
LIGMNSRKSTCARLAFCGWHDGARIESRRTAYGIDVSRRVVRPSMREVVTVGKTIASNGTTDEFNNLDFLYGKPTTGRITCPGSD